MKRKIQKHFVLLLLFSLSLTACSSKPQQEQQPAFPSRQESGQTSVPESVGQAAITPGAADVSSEPASKEQATGSPEAAATSPSPAPQATGSPEAATASPKPTATPTPATAQPQESPLAPTPSSPAQTALPPAEDGASSDTFFSETEQITLDPLWEYASYSKINSGAAVLYKASENRKNLTIGVNAGHGTTGGAKVKNLCHPDGSAKTTGGSTAKGATEATAVSGGMTFQDGTPERTVTLRMAQCLRDKLLKQGYDVLMLRDGEDVQLDNIARTVICNNTADCHIALHWDGGDGKDYDKGCFYIAVPDGMKTMEPVQTYWQQHDALGESLIDGLRGQGAVIYGNGSMYVDLTQTAYSTIPSVDMELGNVYSDYSDSTLDTLADGLVAGIDSYFSQS